MGGGRGRKPTLACMVPLQQCMLELTGSQTQYEHPSIKTNTGNVTPNIEALQTDHQLPYRPAVSEPLGVYTNRDSSRVL